MTELNNLFISNSFSFVITFDSVLLQEAIVLLLRGGNGQEVRKEADTMYPSEVIHNIISRTVTVCGLTNRNTSLTVLNKNN